MSDPPLTELAEFQDALERATRDAKKLRQRLSADLQEQTRQHEAHLLVDAPPRNRSDDDTAT
jgi:hypothetical protein